MPPQKSPSRRLPRRPTASAPIGVFDSGVGGLTVVRALASLLPKENWVYLGDTARVPYGTKSAESVRRFSLEISQFLLRHRVKMIVVACNSASALALPTLQKQLPVPVIGVIEPGARAAQAATRKGPLGVIGTPATVRSGAYAKALRRRDKKLRVLSQACPLFVPLVEEGWLDHPVTRQIAALYLQPLLKKKIDTLILGCTHYPLLKKTLQRTAPRVRLIDSAQETAREVKNLLAAQNLLATKGKGKGLFFSSDDPQKFRSLGQRFLGKNLGPVRRASLSGIKAS